jgi:hypothetical protein
MNLIDPILAYDGLSFNLQESCQPSPATKPRDGEGLQRFLQGLAPSPYFRIT